MKMRFLVICLLALTSFTVSANAQIATPEVTAESNSMDELNPFDPNIEDTLRQMDEDFQSNTGKPAVVATPLMDELLDIASGCRRSSCTIWARVVKSEQRMYLSLNGNVIGVYPTSTGTAGHGTPNFDTRPNGRIYDRYTSKKFPGGDFDGLGNMPYAVFISGGFAIHGTGRGNWAKLGRPASHGCVRIHPDHARLFNRLVRQYGISQTWITIQ